MSAFLVGDMLIVLAHKLTKWCEHKLVDIYKGIDNCSRSFFVFSRQDTMCHVPLRALPSGMLVSPHKEAASIQVEQGLTKASLVERS